eukprot:s368_g9.t1
MTLKPGSRGYLCLGADFQDPKWREAIVLHTEEKWMKCLVRCSLQEAENAGLSMVQKDDAVFCMVESEFHHLVSGVPFEVMKLAAGNGELMKLGGDALQSEGELTFASLSEAPKIAARKKTKKAATSSSEESSSEDGDMFQNLRKSWLGDGTGKGKSKRDGSTSPVQRSRSKRFALLEKKRSKSSASADQDAQDALLQAAIAKGDPLQGLMALQLAQVLEKKKKRRRGHRRRSRSSSSAESSSSSSSSSPLASSSKGHQKAVDAYQKAGRRMFAEPLRHVRHYVKEMEKELGAEDRPWRVVDYNRKIAWKNQKGLQRCHYLVGVILEYLLRREPEKAALQTVLTLQSIHQASLDNGDWQIAWMLTHVEDPFQRRLFGGDAGALQHVTSYLRSMNELAKTTDNLKKKGAGKGDSEDLGEKKEGKGRKKGKGKDNKEGKDTTSVDN